MNAGLLLVLVAFLAACALPRRAKELTAEGRPLLRYPLPARVCLASTLLWIVLTYERFREHRFERTPDDLVVHAVFIAISLVGAAWFFLGWRTTLVDDSIEHAMWPLRTLRYRLDEAVAVQREGVFSIEFPGRRRFAVLPVASGRRHFVDALDARLRAIGK